MPTSRPELDNIHGSKYIFPNIYQQWQVKK